MSVTARIVGFSLGVRLGDVCMVVMGYWHSSQRAGGRIFMLVAMRASLVQFFG